MKKSDLLASVVLTMAASSLFAKCEFGCPFTDRAVLQRDREVPVWGTADPGEKVVVSFAGQRLETAAGADGRWEVRLAPMAASKESRTLTANDVEVRDVLVGEVWFAAGQSNMECLLWHRNTRYRDRRGATVIAMANQPLIRFANNDHAMSVTPRKFHARWHKFTAEDLSKCEVSAVAYFFARELYLALGIPIGIVEASWGGTNIDAWTPRSGYDGCDKSIQGTAEWKVVEKADFKPCITSYAGRTITSDIQQPTVLYNGMVAAWAPMAMRGFIWYQGCHNAYQAETYTAKMHALYNGWARDFRNPGLKLYFAQLAPYRQNWNKLVAAQNKFVDEQPNAAIAVLADVGNFDDIHPNDKETVGQRLALHALKRDYGFPIENDDSPRFRSYSVGADGCVTIRCDHVKNWYVYNADRKTTAPFELAGTNGVWKAAEIANFRPSPAKKPKAPTYVVDVPELVLKSAEVPAPVAVRYMGRAMTMGTVYNEMALPLGPFESTPADRK